MKLSILDVMPISSGHSPSEALQGAVELARLADACGYERLWYAEHHGLGSIASTSPELMIAHVGAATKGIRLGAGGVMLPNHVPLRVVEQYRTLEALFPGRVDMGIGRAAGTDPVTARALRSDPSGAFPERMAELLAFDRGEFPASHPWSRLNVTPAGVRLPPMYMLGSSGGSAVMAGQLGCAYAFASHFSPMPPRPATDAYRAAFRPSEDFAAPHVIQAMHVIVGETQEEADELALPVLYLLTHFMRDGSTPLLTPDEVRATGFTARDASGPMAMLLIHGDGASVRRKVERILEVSGADEPLVMTLCHCPEARLRSYRLLAEAFDVAPRASAAA